MSGNVTDSTNNGDMYKEGRHDSSVIKYPPGIAQVLRHCYKDQTNSLERNCNDELITNSLKLIMKHVIKEKKTGC